MPRKVAIIDGTEAQLLRACLLVLAAIPGIHVMRLNAGLTILGKGASKRAIRGCEPGTPDLLVMLPNERVLWLELKTRRGKLSDSQRQWHAMAVERGHTVHVVRSVDDAVAAVRGAM